MMLNCSNVNFELFLPEELLSSCDTFDNFDEGVELSIRFNAEGSWIPINLIIPIRNRFLGPSITIGNKANLEIRGYAVNFTTGDIDTRASYFFQICDYDQQVDSFQLRWLQTSYVDIRNAYKDVWSIDNVLVEYEPVEGVKVDLLKDSFDDEQIK